MATSSSSVHLERVRFIQSSLKQVQLRWFVKPKGEVGGPVIVQLSIIDQSGGDCREWLRQTDARENSEEVYDIPSHLLVSGHIYNISIKLISRYQKSDDDFNGLMQVLDTSVRNFHLGKYAIDRCHVRRVQKLCRFYFCDIFGIC